MNIQDIQTLRNDFGAAKADNSDAMLVVQAPPRDDDRLQIHSYTFASHQLNPDRSATQIEFGNSHVGGLLWGLFSRAGALIDPEHCSVASTLVEANGAGGRWSAYLITGMRGILWSRTLSSSTVIVDDPVGASLFALDYLISGADKSADKSKKNKKFRHCLEHDTDEIADLAKAMNKLIPDVGKRAALRTLRPDWSESRIRTTIDTMGRFERRKSKEADK